MFDKRILLLSFWILSACDDENKALFGGPGGSVNSTDITAGDGFCGPVGGLDALGQAAFDSGAQTARIDTDGDPSKQGLDATWQPTTSGTVNGQPINSAKYSYVVMSQEQMNASGVALGDWSTITNPATGATTFGRVSDIGPPGNNGEISESAANAIGIQFLPNSYTVGNPSVVIKAYAGSSGIQGDCATVSMN